MSLQEWLVREVKRSQKGVNLHKDPFTEMLEKWPSGLVARTEVARFTGGLLSPAYMANLDSLGQGPDRIHIGRKCCYPTHALVEWLRSRSNRSDLGSLKREESGQ